MSRDIFGYKNWGQGDNYWHLAGAVGGDYWTAPYNTFLAQNVNSAEVEKPRAIAMFLNLCV